MTNRIMQDAVVPPETGKVVTENGKVVGYVDGVVMEGPLAALSAFKATTTTDDQPTVVAEPAEVERTAEEDALLFAEAKALVAAAGIVQPTEGEAPRENHGRRRHKKSKKSVTTVAAEVAVGEVADGKVMPPAPAPEKSQGKVRAPQFGGIRKIELVQVAPTPASPPTGTIGLRRFLKFNYPGQLVGVAREIADKGATPDVVIWSKSHSGFDHARIVVVLVNGKSRDGGKPLQLPNLKIVEASGKFADLAQYIGQELRYGEVMNFPGKDGKPRLIPEDRAARTRALNAVLVEASERLEKAEARKNARPAVKEETPAKAAE